MDQAVARRRAARDLRRLADEVADVVDRPGWHQWAACRGQVDVMFPVATTEKAVAPAIQLCGTCEVFDECQAASVGERDGVWAGEVRVRVVAGR